MKSNFKVRRMITTKAEGFHSKCVCDKSTFVFCWLVVVATRSAQKASTNMMISVRCLKENITHAHTEVA